MDPEVYRSLRAVHERNGRSSQEIRKNLRRLSRERRNAQKRLGAARARIQDIIKQQVADGDVYLLAKDEYEICDGVKVQHIATIQDDNGDGADVFYVSFAAGAQLPMHAHTQHVQWLTVLNGELLVEFELRDEHTRLTDTDTIQIEQGIRHSVTAPVSGSSIITFKPPIT